jgi:hypothetical protein
MVKDPSMDTSLLHSKHKAIATLFPYAVCLERGGQREMVDAIFHAVSTSGLFIRWLHVRTCITTLFNESSPPSLDRAIALMSPYILVIYQGRRYQVGSGIISNLILGGTLPERCQCAAVGF